MPLSAFETLPDNARLWLIAFSQPISADQLAPEIGALLGHWRHKGIQYTAAWAVLEGRLLAVAEPTLAAQPSGCAIDGMLRSIKQSAHRLGLDLLDPMAVLTLGEEGVQIFNRSELPARLEDGTLGAHTPVLDLSLLSLGDLRAGRLQRPLVDTWIGRKYKIQAPAMPGA
jgi:hypothetical protein